MLIANCAHHATDIQKFIVPSTAIVHQHYRCIGSRKMPKKFLVAWKCLQRRGIFEDPNGCYNHTWHCQRRTKKFWWSQPRRLPLIEGTSGEIFAPNTVWESACELQGNGITSMAVFRSAVGLWLYFIVSLSSVWLSIPAFTVLVTYLVYWVYIVYMFMCVFLRLTPPYREMQMWMRDQLLAVVLVAGVEVMCAMLFLIYPLYQYTYFEILITPIAYHNARK